MSQISIIVEKSSEASLGEVASVKTCTGLWRSADFRALIESLPEGGVLVSSQIPDDWNASAAEGLQVTDGEGVWQAFQPGSFSEFCVASLGLPLASLWLPLEQSGVFIASKEDWKKLAANPSRPLTGQATELEGSLAASPTDIEFSELEDSWLPVLRPGRGRIDQPTNRALGNIEAWLPESLNRRSADGLAVMAGIYQWFDELDRSHEFAQDGQHQGTHNGPNYWHQIMHRREGDDSNSKYWVRQAGSHPIHDNMREVACSETIAGGATLIDHWSPSLFVDNCSRCRSGSAEEMFARRLQAIEMVLLQRASLRFAMGYGEAL